MKFRPVRAELFRADRVTGMMKLIDILCNFSERPIDL